MLPFLSSLFVASTSSFWNTSLPTEEFITYTTNCVYERNCRTIYTLISEVKNIKISKFETKVNYIYKNELNNFERLLPRWIQANIVTNKHKKKQWFGDDWKRVKVRALRQNMDKKIGKFEDITQPTIFYNYANCERGVFSAIPKDGKKVARNYALSYSDSKSVSRAGFPLISGSLPVHFKHLCPNWESDKEKRLDQLKKYMKASNELWEMKKQRLSVEEWAKNNKVKIIIY